MNPRAYMLLENARNRFRWQLAEQYENMRQGRGLDGLAGQRIAVYAAHKVKAAPHLDMAEGWGFMQIQAGALAGLGVIVHRGDMKGLEIRALEKAELIIHTV